MATAVDWSAMPKDVLYLISNKLILQQASDADYVRFRSVCTTWRSAASKRAQLPWLIGHRKDEEGKYILFSFYRLSFQDDHRILHIPQLPEKSIHDGMECIGSSHGWMALTKHASQSTVLFNPLTQSTIQLPAPSNSCRSDATHCKFIRIMLSSDPASPDCVALTSCRHGKYFYCRPRIDGVWTGLRRPKFKGWGVEAFFHRGLFYIVTYGDVYVCDFGPDQRVKKIASVSRKRSGLGEIDDSYLVESDGDLLVVLVYWPGFGRKGFWFKVFKVEWGEQAKLVKVKSLGDRALFVGKNNSFSLSASQFHGCRGNTIYYFWTYHHGKRRATTKLRAYDLKDGSDVFFNDDVVHPYEDWKPFAWFAPSLQL